MKKRPIPAPTENNRFAFDMAVKENLEVIIGHRGGKIKKLGNNAQLSEVIDKINEILERLQ